MGWIKIAVLGIAVVFVGVKIAQVCKEPPMPTLDLNPWWGEGQKQPDNIDITQFKISIPQKDIDDLKRRLSLPLRLTPALEFSKFTYGFNSDTLSRIVKYWNTKYDWRQREAQLNKYPHYKTKIEGLDIHFMRAKGDSAAHPGVKVVPLLLIHGWPGSFVEFYRILPLLTTPQEGSNVIFDVICPSIPGYGFSQGPVKEGLGMPETAQIFLKLMQRLGYDKFYVQGGDWGAGISTYMATMYQQNILGVHVNMLFLNSPMTTLRLIAGSFLPTFITGDTTVHDLYPLSHFMSRMLQETGYMHIQATKPDTIGSAVNQSPVSLAVYIMEKFSTWTNKQNPEVPDGALLNRDFPIPFDFILDNVCIYWFTNSITTSVRYYKENLGKNFQRDYDRIPVRVPAGIAIFPQELISYPKSFASDKFHDIVTYRFVDHFSASEASHSFMSEGGHFAAMERPQILAAEVHKFVTMVEERV